MKKLDLSQAADEFEMISSETHLFYNVETGEFDYYSDFMDMADADSGKFEDDAWIAAPRQWDIKEYDIMVAFTETVTNPRKIELLSAALQGKGAFRRFKDNIYRLDLEDEWFSFKRSAYMELAREWCTENNIEYVGESGTPESEPVASENTGSLDMIIIPLSSKIADDAAEVMRDALKYKKTDATNTIKHMLSRNRIAFAAIADSRVVGIIGAIPQYGVTGWELHPLAVLKEYQRRGIGTELIKALESEVAMHGGVMIYLGSDDESGTTSLYGVDLYDDIFEKIKNIQNINGHPFPFYEKHGYKIVGVFPDANGIGKPDIWMAKRIKEIRKIKPS